MKPKLVINVEHIVCYARYSESDFSEEYTQYNLVWWFTYDTLAYDISIMENSNSLFIKL